MTADEIEKIVADTKHLREYQETPSSQEELKTIPMLTLEDIDKAPVPVVNEERPVGGFPGLVHAYETRGIGYMKLMFDISKMPKRLMSYAGLLAAVLGNIDTKNYEYQDLNNEISMYTGGIYTTASVYGAQDPDGYSLRFEVGGRAMTARLGQMATLMEEMMFESRLDDVKRLKEIVDEQVSRLQMAFNSAGHAVAVNRATSYFSEAGAVKEQLSGMDYYHFIRGLAEDFDARSAQLTAALKETAAFIFRKDNVMIDLTGREDVLSAAEEALLGLKDRLYGQIPGKEAFTFEPQAKNEGFITSGMVQYAVCAGNFVKAGYRYHGGLNVLKVIMEYEYLWTALRVKGGAYGCMSGFSRNGNAYLHPTAIRILKKHWMYTVSVPNILKILKSATGICLNILSGRSALPMHRKKPFLAAARSLGAYFAGLTNEDLQKTRDEMLSTNQETIRSFAGLVESFVSQNYMCVVGSESQIDKNRSLFGAVENL